MPLLTMARKWCEWWDQKPTYQWTLGNNPLLGKDENGQAKSHYTAKLSRAGRLVERGIFIGFGVAALLGGPAAIPFLGVTAGHMTMATAGIALFNLKANSIVMGWVAHGATLSARFLTQWFDQIFNGPDENRVGAEYAKQVQKMNKQMGMKPGGLSPATSPPEPVAQPSVIDQMIALGHRFNGKAGQMSAPQRQALGNIIWGDNTNQQVPQTTSNQYETAFNVPTEDNVRIASSGRESVQMHNMHYGNPPPEHHHHEAPPAPAYKPPGCDNN
jgi:hypothetical protein